MVEDQQPPAPLKQIKQDPYLAFAWRVAKGEANGEFVYCMQEDKFYQYKEGVWIHIYDLAFLGHICKHIKEITRCSLAARKQVIENYKVIKYKNLTDFNNTNLITLKNKMLNPYDGSTSAHHSDYYSTIMLKYDYDETQACELWLKTLNEIFDNDPLKVDLLQEFFGYCLVPDMEQKKALLLLGESDTGKSTILFTLRDLLGQENCSSVALKYISNPQYTPMMVNKLVNIDADVDKNAANYEAEFKMITSGEPINCNQKFIETFEFIPKCKIVLAANIFPKITDHSSAFYKRLLLIPCDRIFGEHEKNRNLTKELKQELPGILNWAIKGLRRLKERNRFEQYDFMRNAVKELEDENNPVNVFFEEHITPDVSDDFYIEKGDLYDKYISWTIKTNTGRLSLARFSVCVFKKYHSFTTKKARLEGGSGKRIWRNLKYIDSKLSQPDLGWQENSQ